MKKIWLLTIFNKLSLMLLKPRVILGFKRYDGVNLPQTRISNTVYIGNYEKFNIGNNVYIGHYGVLDCSNDITIGDGCQIATHVVITTHSSHRSIRLYGDYYAEHSPNLVGYVRGSINIGKYTFIGAHATIMPNTIIGKGSIVSAYSLVKGTFPDYAIISGNPAMVVGDTRTLDKKHLEDYSELDTYYNEWAND